jgi:hypothetical protein
LSATGRRFSPVSSTNKTDRHDITEILLKVAFNTTALILTLTLRCIALLHFTIGLGFENCNYIVNLAVCLLIFVKLTINWIRQFLFLLRRVSLVEQELLTLMEHIRSPPPFSGVRVDRSLVLCVVFYRPLFVLLSFFFLPLCCLSFELRILIALIWCLQTLLRC